LKAFGIVAIVMGVLAMLAPGLTGLSIAVMIGLLVIVAGVVRMVWASQTDSVGRGLMTFAIGGLTLLCGIGLVSNPLFAAGTLTIILTAYFFADGALEVIAGLRLRPETGWGPLLFAGTISILLGAMIWRQYPLSGPWAVGILVGIKLFLVGLVMLAAGSRANSAA
jgi:uncharacterized membrane protein HdeD (DUF308 family)